VDHKKKMKDMEVSSYLYAGNAAFMEEQYALYLKNPEDVDESWRQFFTHLQQTGANRPSDVDHAIVRESFRFQAKQNRGLRKGDFQNFVASVESKQVSVLQLINAYRFRGHQQAQVDPLNLQEQTPVADLTHSFHGLTDADLEKVFNTGSMVGPQQAKLREILAHLRETYCSHIGAEYMHITSTSEKRWIQERLESTRSQPGYSPEKRRQILERVYAAEGLEKFLHTKYVGQKRFSLEGGESMIPMLDSLIQRSGEAGVQEMVMGMAHRGRLNVLINVLGKAPSVLFSEFEGNFDPSTNEGSGDVKYHQGFSSDIQTKGGILHLALAFNPSHLEIISPVVEGSVRARQHRRGDKYGKQILPVLIHGDAAFAGQGVVMETFNMSQARGFTTGGSIHIIINNQIGFTTSNPMDARSTPHCTEVARMVQAPIFHVNGDDPEAVVYAAELAFEYRMKFQKDVIIDMVCYRRHGHSEADEPSATQPIMYRKIRQHPTVTRIHGERMTAQEVITAEQLRQIEDDYRDHLSRGDTVAPNIVTGALNNKMVDWTPYRDTKWTYPVSTSVDTDIIADMARRLMELPEGFRLHSRVAKIMEDRLAMASDEQPLDWGFCEILAYATLLRDGYSVRLTGQDSGRGTFFHRHAVLHHQEQNEAYVPLQHIVAGPPYFTVIDSLLSEEAVLGFEYGYAATDPKTLVIWEAQFGDFANNAQVVIDQFISSGESKWGRYAGLVMFLPHGYDGQGPEHSSARLERYLQICAEENMQVCIPSVPSQMFHMLRRQMLRPYRKPLIVMTPKSLLRHKESVSRVSDLDEGEFRTVIADNSGVSANKVSRVVLCSGKVYFDLLQGSRKQEADDVAIVRVEQLYPFPAETLSGILAQYPNAKKIVWCQEEPENQGAWNFIVHLLQRCILPQQQLLFAGRPASASPAVGYLKKHLEQQQKLVEDAFTV
jgi:2-oxoglutarate dehydrogenase E1 component